MTRTTVSMLLSLLSATALQATASSASTELPERYPLTPVTASCIYGAAVEQQLPVEILVALLVVEGGRVGAVSTNKNRTVDIGPMQVNSIHVPKDERGREKFTALKNNGCYNVRYGAYRLRAEIQRAGEFWTGVGNYHSQTPAFHRRYLEKVKSALQRTEGYSRALRSAFEVSDSVLLSESGR